MNSLSSPMMISIDNYESDDCIDEISTLVKKFKDKGLRCIFLREEKYLSLDESDLDFWCSVDEKHIVVDILLEQGWFVVGGRSCTNNAGESYVLRFAKSDVHPVFELWIGDLRADAIIFCNSDDLVGNSILHGDLYLLADEFLLNILILRPLLKRRNLHGYINRVSGLEITENQKNNWLVRCNEKFGSRISRYCKNALEGRPGRLGITDILLLSLKQYSMTGLASLLWSRLALKLNKFIYRPPLVNFIGTDGSGKSTTADALLEFMKAEDIHASYVYAGRSKNNSGLVKLARSFIFKLGLAKKISEDEWKTQALSGSKSGKKQAGPIIQLLALLVYFMEYHTRYFKIKLFSRFNKQTQILDRGSWDIATINGLANFPVGLAKYCPVTDITFFCYARPRVIQSRKLERSFAEIIRHQAIYKLLGRCSDNVFVYLDTTRDMETLNRIAYQYFTTLMAIHNGELDDRTARLLRNMPLSVWANQSY